MSRVSSAGQAGILFLSELRKKFTGTAAFGIGGRADGTLFYEHHYAADVFFDDRRVARHAISEIGRSAREADRHHRRRPDGCFNRGYGLARLRIHGPTYVIGIVFERRAFGRIGKRTLIILIRMIGGQPVIFFDFLAF